MPVLDLGADYTTGQTATAAIFNTKFQAIKDLLNTTKLDQNNLQLSAIVAAIAANTSLLYQLGVPVFADGTFSGSVSTTTYAALSPTVTITIPLDGNYIISHGFNAINSIPTGSPTTAYQSYSIGAAAPATDQAQVQLTSPDASAGGAVGAKRETALTAGVVLTLKGKVAGASANWGYLTRWIQAVKVP